MSKTNGRVKPRPNRFLRAVLELAFEACHDITERKGKDADAVFECGFRVTKHWAMAGTGTQKVVRDMAREAHAVHHVEGHIRPANAPEWSIVGDAGPGMRQYRCQTGCRPGLLRPNTDQSRRILEGNDG